MEVGKEFAGFVLPFAAGTAFAAYSGAGCIKAACICASLSSAAAAVCASVLLYMVCSRKISSGTMGMIVSAGLCCGLMCGYSGEILTVSCPHEDGSFFSIHFGQRMKILADSLQFDGRQTNALIKALVTGDRSDIPPSVSRTFRDSGASHILALSGLHLGMIYGITAKTMSVAGNSRPAIILRAIVTTATCGVYTLATGASPSITRAFIFIAMAETARLTSRNRNLGTVLTGALVLHLVLSPVSVKSAGFQLSYAAMAGIAWIYPPLKGFWPADSKGRFRFAIMHRIWDTAAMSISCQATAGAVAWMYFGTFPRRFLITNLIALPLSSLLIPSALLAIVLEGIGTCPEPLCRIAGALADMLVRSLETICEM